MFGDLNMMTRTQLSVLALVLSCSCLVYGATIVEVRGRQLFVNNAQFSVRGVIYAPVPAGIDPETTPPFGDYFTSFFKPIWTRDLPLIRAMGANTIRVYGWANDEDHADFLDACYNNGVNPIYVVPTFALYPEIYKDLSNTGVQAQIVQDYSTFVKSTKSHPAILFYSIGEDVNYFYSGELPSLFSVLKGLALQSKIIEIANPKPVTASLLDDGVAELVKTYDSNSEAIDFWSVSTFRGCEFGDLFSTYAAVSKKPIFIGAYGIDAWNDTSSSEDQVMQARCVASLAGELEANVSIAIGGSVQEYSDEWWRAKYGQTDARHPGCPNRDATRHATCGFTNLEYPDKYSNLAWYGLVDAQTHKPRLVYNQLQELWRIA